MHYEFRFQHLDTSMALEWIHGYLGFDGSSARFEVLTAKVNSFAHLKSYSIVAVFSTNPMLQPSFSPVPFNSADITA